MTKHIRLSKVITKPETLLKQSEKIADSLDGEINILMRARVFAYGTIADYENLSTVTGRDGSFTLAGDCEADHQSISGMLRSAWKSEAINEHT